MNVFIMIGKVKEVLSDNKNDLLNKYLIIEVTRPYFDSEGQVINDLFKVRLWRGLSETISDNINKNINILIKGRIEIENQQTIIIAESVQII
ncbi:MAG: hypothetical protein SPK49_05000 [Erysipelotrichaceae bacterium]|nr:hypothetical protein [Erysipelotrichaceae bacterium]